MEEPSSGMLLLVAVTEIEEPTICTGIWAERPPLVAVMVAVLLIPDGPAEKVTTALPFESVVPVEALSCPVDVENVTVCAGSTELLLVSTVAVIVVELAPSLVTLALLEASVMVAAAVAEVGDFSPLAPQPASNAVVPVNIKTDNNLAEFE